MATNKKPYFSFQYTEDERNLLDKYCEETGRNKVDVVRELIRSLKLKLESFAPQLVTGAFLKCKIY